MSNQKKVLIVDDSSTNNLLFTAILEENNYSAIVASSAEEGIEVARREKPDLILLDIMMPGKDGFHLLEEIKQKDQNKEVKILMISAKNDVTSIKKAHEMGAADYMVKPIRIKELLEKLNKLV